MSFKVLFRVLLLQVLSGLFKGAFRMIARKDTISEILSRVYAGVVLDYLFLLPGQI